MISDRTAERFWAKVERRSDDECWPWLAFLRKDGYGMFRVSVGESMWAAPRVAWAIANGPIPENLHVLHHCDNRACCNPAHLYVGTPADNARDKVERGRSSYPHPWRQGEKHHSAKLTDEQVREIRQRLSTEIGRRLASEFGVSPATITNIKKRKVWKHL